MLALHLLQVWPGLYQYTHDSARSDRAELVWSADSRRPESTHSFDLGAREPYGLFRLDMNKRLAIEADEATA
jgi:hypothetical protein